MINYYSNNTLHSGQYIFKATVAKVSLSVSLVVNSMTIFRVLVLEVRVNSLRCVLKYVFVLW